MAKLNQHKVISYAEGKKVEREYSNKCDVCKDNMLREENVHSTYVGLAATVCSRQTYYMVLSYSVTIST